MRQTWKRNLYTVITIFFLVTLDQASKLLVQYMLKGRPDIRLLPEILHFHYLENTGGAFSLLENQQIFFLIFTPILLIVFVCVMQKLPKNPRFNILRILLIFLISGAAGNLLDRMANGFVIDFIYFVPINFPVFNIADVYVTVSVFVLAALILFYYRDEDLNCLGIALGIRKETDNNEEHFKE